MAEKIKTLHLSVVTPARAFYEGDAVYVQIPVSDGLIGVLPEHSPYVGILGFGVLTLRKVDGAEQEIIIDGGFVEIKADKVTVLANSAEHPEALSREEVDAQFAQAVALKAHTSVELEMRHDKIAAARTRVNYLNRN